MLYMAVSVCNNNNNNNNNNNWCRMPLLVGGVGGGVFIAPRRLQMTLAL